MDLDTMKVVGEIVGSLTTQGVLLYWVFVERKRFETIFAAILGDWERKSQREIDSQVNKNGQGI